MGWLQKIFGKAKPKANAQYNLNVSMEFLGDSVVKNPPANAGDVGLIQGQEDALEKQMATHSGILAW